jgi:hypothetical protein
MVDHDAFLRPSGRPLARVTGAVDAPRSHAMFQLIQRFIPEAGQVDEAGLRTVDPDMLAQYVRRASNPWWRRRPCVHALRDRVPAAQVESLFDCVCDPIDTAEVRVALLDVLPLRESWLPWLRAYTGENRHGVREAILKARAALGDLTVVPDVATLAHDPASRLRVIGEAALETLIDHHGIATIEAALGTERPEDRVFHVRMLARRGGDVIGAFADPDTNVATVACELAVTSEVPHDETLLDHVVTGPTIASRLWAAYVLYRRGRDIRDLWRAIDSPRIEIAGLPDEIRHAILREHAGTPPTDPHWLVERVCVELPTPDVEAQLVRANAALDAAGLAPGPAVEIGEVNQQGGGTYHVIGLVDHGAISVSTLGPFVTSDDEQPLARRALMAAGFRWIDPEVAAIRVDGLSVYYFGERAPLDVGTLLFYWQD